jgi:hypothetical protein
VNGTGLGISYAYAIGLLLTGEALHRFAGLPADLTRKIIHIGAGMWVFGILTLFDRWEIGIIPFATFIFVNFILYRYRVVRAMDREDSSPGTIYFALAITHDLCVPVASAGSDRSRSGGDRWRDGNDVGVTRWQRLWVSASVGTGTLSVRVAGHWKGLRLCLRSAR